MDETYSIPGRVTPKQNQMPFHREDPETVNSIFFPGAPVCAVSDISQGIECKRTELCAL